MKKYAELTDSQIRYLIAIKRLYERQGSVRGADIAKELKLSKASVHRMVDFFEQVQDVSVQLERIKQKFSGFQPCFITRSNASVEHIFAELYTVPQDIRLPYFKIKILELMLFLSVFHLESDELLCQGVSPYQVKLAKEVCEYLTANMDERITLDEVSSYFEISSTKIKNAFKQVYGIPFYAFLKAHKMESAAYMLEHTEESVIEIASKHGYENASKFASAFKSAKGLSPVKYRSVCKRRNISDTASI